MSECISCSDEMPRDLHIVYINYRPDDPTTAMAYRNNGQWIAAGVFYNLTKNPGPFEFRQVIVKDEVTHWGELPCFTAPEDEE